MKFLIDTKAIGPLGKNDGKWGFPLRDETKVVEIPQDISKDIVKQLKNLSKRSRLSRAFEKFWLEKERPGKAFVVHGVEKELAKLGIDCRQLEDFIVRTSVRLE